MSMGPSTPSSILAALDTDRLLEWLLRFGLDFVTFAALGLLLALVTPNLLPPRRLSNSALHRGRHSAGA